MCVSEEPRAALAELDREAPKEAQRESRVPLRLLFVLAAVLRLAFVLYAHPTRAFIFSDMQSYDSVALEVLSGTTNVWHAFRPVGYSLLLALVYALTDASRTFVGVLQALMGAALAPWSADLARAAGASRATSLAVGAVVATSIPLILYCGLLLTEIPSAFFLVLALRLAMAREDSPRAPAWSGSSAESRASMHSLLSGLCLGLAGAVRPNFLLVYPVVALYLWRRIRLAGGRRVQPWALLGLGLLLPLAVVSGYNSHALGRPCGPSANGGLNFYLNFADVHTIQYRGPVGQYWISPVPNGFDHTRQELTDVPLYEDGYYYARGLSYVRAHPSSLLSALQNFPEAAGMGRQLLWPHWPGHERLLGGYARAFFLLVLLPALAAMAILTRRGYRAFRARKAASDPVEANFEALTLALLCASSALPIYLFLGDPRVRVPFDPLWVVLAGLAFEALVRFAMARLRRQRSP
jgi:hypothetical protein